MFFERPDAGESAILVHIDFPEGAEREDPQEFFELVRSAGGNPVALIKGTRSRPDAKTFVGKGKLEEIREAVQTHGADLVLFNHALTPSQERNVERAIECRVLDRTGLILDIFAQRARTHEGKLQVELAQLQHQATRLVRGWTHLERQGGGIGLRGPGETQLETDRRLLGDRVSLLERRLRKVEGQREQGRRARKRSSIQTVSLVGYTNAGKSTLFNALTKAAVYAADQLFATLDPTMRRVQVQGMGEVVLADTVGFIRHLPHKLVNAFKATLQETQEADLLLHVVDTHDNERAANMQQVEVVLAEIDALEKPILQVFNKIDLMPGVEPRIDRDENGLPWRVWVSAKDNLGFDLLLQAISERLANSLFVDEIQIAPHEGQLRALLYAQNAVLNERIDDEGRMMLEVRIELADFKKILHKASVPESRFLEVNLEHWEEPAEADSDEEI
ncbi:MAG: GTPase HflX [Oceanospirillaceae bacterium]|nr:GTPase HflX [Oceanospirillaceae bacterium]MCP5335668.1 GTPase HflX [Oceanospirillaceae bacterium]MCP5350323.1 GTPase HflX [Oceanospirillaceae bacterium]